MLNNSFTSATESNALMGKRNPLEFFFLQSLKKKTRIKKYSTSANMLKTKSFNTGRHRDQYQTYTNMPFNVAS